ncbi:MULTISPECIES: glycosyltransferase [unclassified Bacillus (in: firmicutes)]
MKTVQALDGLLLATQYDVLWRKGIFDGWPLYENSQCFEFRKKDM